MENIRKRSSNKGENTKI